MTHSTTAPAKATTQTKALPQAIKDFIQACDQPTPDALIDTFANDAMVRDVARDLRGTDHAVKNGAIRK